MHFLNIQFTKINHQVLINSCFYRILQCILFRISFFKIIYKYLILNRIYDPVFSYTCCSVFKKLRIIVRSFTCRRNNLNNPVWCVLLGGAV